MNPHRKLAVEIRRTIRAAYPGLAFRVTTASTYNGNCADVEWVDGPTEAQLVDQLRPISKIHAYRTFSPSAKEWAEGVSHPCYQHSAGLRMHRCKLLDETPLPVG